MSNNTEGRYPIEIKELLRGWKDALETTKKKAPARSLPLYVEGWNGAKELLKSFNITSIDEDTIDDEIPEFGRAERSAFQELRGPVKNGFVARGY